MSAWNALATKRGLGVTVDAAEGDLARGWFQRGDAVSLGAFGGFDFELCALEEELMTLEVGAIGVTPSAAADIVDVARVADGENEGCGLVVLEFLDVARKDVDEGVCDACEDYAFDVAVLNGQRDLFVQPGCELGVGEVAHGDVDAVCEGEGALVGDVGPVACGDEGGDGAEIGIGVGGDVFVKVELFLGELAGAAADELEGEGDEEEFGVGCAGFLEDFNGLLVVAAEEGPTGCHGVDGGRVFGVGFAVDATGVVAGGFAPAA